MFISSRLSIAIANYVILFILFYTELTGEEKIAYLWSYFSLPSVPLVHAHIFLPTLLLLFLFSLFNDFSYPVLAANAGICVLISHPTSFSVSNFIHVSVVTSSLKCYNFAP